MTMVEKVARALWDRARQNYPRPAWDDIPAAHKALTLDSARLAIEAMREPTHAMRESAGRLVDHCAVQNYGSPPATDDVWDTMIDAALAETPAHV